MPFINKTIGIKYIVKTIVSSSVPEAITDTPFYVNDFVVYNPTGNGDIYIGDSEVGTDAIPTEAGEKVPFYYSRDESCGYNQGAQFDLSKIYIRAATSGNSVVIRYLASES